MIRADYPQNIIRDIFYSPYSLDRNVAPTVATFLENFKSVKVDYLLEVEKDVIELYYEHNHTLLEISHIKGWTKQRIHQLKDSALRKLRDEQVRDILLGVKPQGSAVIRDENFDVIPNLNTSLSAIHLSYHIRNVLHMHHIHTIGDVINYTTQDLLNMKNFGRASVEKLDDALNRNGFHRQPKRFSDSINEIILKYHLDGKEHLIKKIQELM